MNESGRAYVNRLDVLNIVSPYSDVMRSLVQPEEKSLNSDSVPADEGKLASCFAISTKSLLVATASITFCMNYNCSIYPRYTVTGSVSLLATVIQDKGNYRCMPYFKLWKI